MPWKRDSAIVISVEQNGEPKLKMTNNTSEYLLTLANDHEAEIATEFGDGSTFVAGEMVYHNPTTGTYRKVDTNPKEGL